MELNWLVIEWKSLMMSPLAELLTCCQNWKCWEMIFSRINCIKTWIFTSRHFYLSSGSFISDRLCRLVSKTEVTLELAGFYFLLLTRSELVSKAQSLSSLQSLVRSLNSSLISGIQIVGKYARILCGNAH